MGTLDFPIISLETVQSFNITLNSNVKLIKIYSNKTRECFVMLESIKFEQILKYIKDYCYIPFSDTTANTLFALYIDSILIKNMLKPLKMETLNNELNYYYDINEIRDLLIGKFVLCLQTYLKYNNENFNCKIPTLKEDFEHMKNLNLSESLTVLKSKIIESTNKKMNMEMINFYDMENKLSDESFDYEKVNYLLSTSDEEFDVRKENYKFSTSSSRHKFRAKANNLIDSQEDEDEEDRLQIFNRKRLGVLNRSTNSFEGKKAMIYKPSGTPIAEKDISILLQNKNHSDKKHFIECFTDNSEDDEDVLKMGNNTINSVIKANQAKLEMDNHLIKSKKKLKRKKKFLTIFDSDDSQDIDTEPANGNNHSQTNTTVDQIGENEKDTNMENFQLIPNIPNAAPQEGGLEENQVQSNKASRRNIRKIKTLSQLTEETKKAFKDEQARLKRIADNRDKKMKAVNELEERRKKYFEQSEPAQDIYLETRDQDQVEGQEMDLHDSSPNKIENEDQVAPKEGIDLKIDVGLSQFLKPHQIKGINFLYENVLESWKRFNHGKDPGNGCILAHLMGLGKTLQVISLLHTIMTDYHYEPHVRTCLIICPQNVCLNWMAEIGKWMQYVEVPLKYRGLFHAKDRYSRRMFLNDWRQQGGLMVLGYNLFRKLITLNNTRHPKYRKAIEESLIDPGPDILVCDEGHLLKNSSSIIFQCVDKIRSRRRIVLTGTPLQNNLYEYHCMVQLVRPNILGSRIEFQNMFVNPIYNGQCADSTEVDVKLMKKRAHILNKKLSGFVQRMDYSVFKKKTQSKKKKLSSKTTPVKILNQDQGDTTSGAVQELDDPLNDDLNELDEQLTEQLKLNEEGGEDEDDSGCSIMNTLSTKYEYVIFVRLTPKQIQMYSCYLNFIMGTPPPSSSSDGSSISTTQLNSTNFININKTDSNLIPATNNHLTTSSPLNIANSHMQHFNGSVDMSQTRTLMDYQNNDSQLNDLMLGDSNMNPTIVLPSTTNASSSSSSSCLHTNKFNIFICYQELYNILIHPWLCPMREFKREILRKSKMDLVLSDEDALSLDKFNLDEPALDEEVMSNCSTISSFSSLDVLAPDGIEDLTHHRGLKRNLEDTRKKDGTNLEHTHRIRRKSHRKKLPSFKNVGTQKVASASKNEENLIFNQITEDLLNEKSLPPWWTNQLGLQDAYDIFLSGKIVLILEIMKEAEAIGDKVLLFTQSLLTLDYIEKILAIIDHLINPYQNHNNHNNNTNTNNHKDNKDKDMPPPDNNKNAVNFNKRFSGIDSLLASILTPPPSSCCLTDSPQLFDSNCTDSHISVTNPHVKKPNLDVLSKLSPEHKIFLSQGWTYPTWSKNFDYFRMDGSTSINNRFESTQKFNDTFNQRARFFMISTKAGSLGVNLIGASRIIIMDASWNPTHDTQSVFRAYRLGQTKPVFVYRLISQGTIEERIYERQVTKQSLSQRVIDKKQVERHYTFDNLRELYSFEPEPYDSQEENEDALYTISASYLPSLPNLPTLSTSDGINDEIDQIETNPWDNKTNNQVLQDYGTDIIPNFNQQITFAEGHIDSVVATDDLIATADTNKHSESLQIHSKAGVSLDAVEASHTSNDVNNLLGQVIWMSGIDIEASEDSKTVLADVEPIELPTRDVTVLSELPTPPEPDNCENGVTKSNLDIIDESNSLSVIDQSLPVTEESLELSGADKINPIGDLEFADTLYLTNPASYTTLLSQEHSVNGTNEFKEEGGGGGGSVNQINENINIMLAICYEQQNKLQHQQQQQHSDVPTTSLVKVRKTNFKKYPIPPVPKDHLLAQLLLDHKRWIVSYSDHDSLLENKLTEELTEEERRVAWEEYEAERFKVTVVVPSNFVTSGSQNILLTTTESCSVEGPTVIDISSSPPQGSVEDETIHGPINSTCPINSSGINESWNAYISCLRSGIEGIGTFNCTPTNIRTLNSSFNTAKNISTFMANALTTKGYVDPNRYSNTDPFCYQRNVQRVSNAFVLPNIFSNTAAYTDSQHHEFGDTILLPRHRPTNQTSTNYRNNAHLLSMASVLNDWASQIPSQQNNLNGPSGPPSKNVTYGVQVSSGIVGTNQLQQPEKKKRKRLKPPDLTRITRYDDMDEQCPNRIAPVTMPILNTSFSSNSINNSFSDRGIEQKIIINFETMQYLYNVYGNVDFNNLYSFMKSKELSLGVPSDNLTFKKKLNKLAQFLKSNKNGLSKMINESRDKYIEITINFPTTNTSCPSLTNHLFEVGQIGEGSHGSHIQTPQYVPQLPTLKHNYGYALTNNCIPSPAIYNSGMQSNFYSPHSNVHAHNNNNTNTNSKHLMFNHRSLGQTYIPNLPQQTYTAITTTISMEPYFHVIHNLNRLNGMTSNANNNNLNNNLNSLQTTFHYNPPKNLNHYVNNGMAKKPYNPLLSSLLNDYNVASGVTMQNIQQPTLNNFNYNDINCPLPLHNVNYNPSNCQPYVYSNILSTRCDAPNTNCNAPNYALSNLQNSQNLPTKRGFRVINGETYPVFD